MRAYFLMPKQVTLILIIVNQLTISTGGFIYSLDLSRLVHNLHLLFCVLICRKSSEQIGIVLKYLSTKSGLTRFKDYIDEAKLDYLNVGYADDDDFVPALSIDDLNYRRAADLYHHYKQPVLVFSTSLNPSKNDPSNTLITVTRAVPLSSQSTNLESPIMAAIGVKLNYTLFAKYFLNHASVCEHKSKCRFDCSKDDVDCFLLDNNGFVVLSDRDFENNSRLFQDSGHFFGEIDIDLFNDLVGRGIYKKVKMYDYQTICIVEGERRSFGTMLKTPFDLLFNLITWFWARIILITFQISINLLNPSLVYGNYFGPNDYDREYIESQVDLKYENDSRGNLIAPSRTSFYPCDKEFFLYKTYKSASKKDQSSKHAYLKYGCEQ